MDERDDDEGRRDEVLAMLPDMIADFLATDVRVDAERCDELLAGLEVARRGGAFEAYGNLYQLSTEAGVAILRNLYDLDGEETSLALDAMMDILRTWRATIG